MLHTAHGYWIAEAGAPDPVPSLDRDIKADVLVVGGGFTGMWTAWHLRQAQPDLRIVLLESDLAGHGPSGRNGGFVDSMWVSFASLCQRYGEAAALDIAHASEASVDQIGDFCETQGIDAWFRKSGYLNVSTSEAQDGSWERNTRALTKAGIDDDFTILDSGDLAGICRSPKFRGGVMYRSAATVQPARLGFGIRQSLLDAGVQVYENSPVINVKDGPGPIVARTPGGSVTADQIVLASGPTLAGRGSPVRQNVTVASSHMVITEPVPDIIDEIGWTGGEAISDCRSLLSYFRTTPDGRIAFGWGGGRIVAGGRRHGRAEVDAEIIGQVAEGLRNYFPQLVDRRLEYAWGGPIDASASHLPHVVELPSGRAYAAFGYTGNGVGPSQMVGRILASRILGLQDSYASLAMVEPAKALTAVPPEPLRWIGGTLIREAIGRKEEAESAERTPDPVSSAVAAIPGLIGFHIGR
ncbi:MAG: FAD-dependent oxidoreductase [Solirubrobacterales bacterium]